MLSVWEVWGLMLRDQFVVEF